MTLPIVGGRMAGCPGPSTEKAAAAAAAAIPSRVPDDEEGPPPYDTVVNVGPAISLTSTQLHPLQGNAEVMMPSLSPLL